MTDTDKNMELWNSVFKTDPKHTKKAKIGGMSITAIAPQYQIQRATEQFGPYAINWGFSKIEFDFSLVESHKLVVFKGDFFCPNGKSQIVNSAKIWMDKAETMIDADFAKKMETDALTKALSKMGFNADVFMGRYDDHKYVTEMEKEFAPPKMTQKEAIERLGQAVDYDSMLAEFKKLPSEMRSSQDVIDFCKVRKEEFNQTK